MTRKKIILYIIAALLILILYFCYFIYKRYVIKYENLKNNNKIKIVINSHKSGTIALNKLLDSLKKCDEFKNYSIIIFIGGYYDNDDGYYENKDENITYVYCNHNSIDFTGLISILEYLPKKDEYYFYLHDTTVVGPSFLKNLNDIDLKNVTSMRLRPKVSMNMGIYSNELIHNSRDILNEFKNTDENKLQYYKNKGVNDEDIIFNNDNNSKIINNKDNFVSVSEPYDYYNTGVMRIVEYYNIDLYKIKANWESKEKYELKN